MDGRLRDDEQGFTLVELLIVIAILGILSALVVFAVGSSATDATASACTSDRRAVLTALEGHAVANGSHPSSLDQLTSTHLKDARISGNVLTGEGYTLTYDPASDTLGACAVTSGGGSGGGTTGGASGGTTGGTGGGTDTAAPTTVASITSGTSGLDGWWTSDVTLALQATDDHAVQSITYSLSGATTAAAQTVNGAVASRSITAEGTTVATFHARDVAGNVEGNRTLALKIDKTAPAGVTIERSGGGPNQVQLKGNAGTSSAFSGDAGTVIVTVHQTGVTAAVLTATRAIAGNGKWDALTFAYPAGGNDEFTARVQQFDGAGNASTDQVVWSR